MSALRFESDVSFPPKLMQRCHGIPVTVSEPQGKQSADGLSFVDIFVEGFAGRWAVTVAALVLSWITQIDCFQVHKM